LFREPDAVTPPVRFEEREQETEPGQTGLRRGKRKPSPTATGRLKPLRLFSTLPQNPSMSVIGILRQQRARPLTFCCWTTIKSVAATHVQRVHVSDTYTKAHA